MDELSESIAKKIVEEIHPDVDLAVIYSCQRMR